MEKSANTITFVKFSFIHSTASSSMQTSSLIEQTYGHKTRIRACGLCFSEDEQHLLLVKHLGLGKNGFWWSVPGGGINFGESAEEAVMREFLEEVGLEVEVKQFLFVNEYIEGALHAIELFFEVVIKSGKVQIGSDPETDIRVIDEVMFMTFEELNQYDSGNYHSIFSEIKSWKDLKMLRGYRCMRT